MPRPENSHRKKFSVSRLRYGRLLIQWHPRSRKVPQEKVSEKISLFARWLVALFKGPNTSCTRQHQLGYLSEADFASLSDPKNRTLAALHGLIDSVKKEASVFTRLLALLTSPVVLYGINNVLSERKKVVDEPQVKHAGYPFRGSHSGVRLPRFGVAEGTIPPDGSIKSHVPFGTAKHRVNLTFQSYGLMVSWSHGPKGQD